MHRARNITCTGHGISRAQGTEYHVHRARNITCTGHSAHMHNRCCEAGQLKQPSRPITHSVCTYMLWLVFPMRGEHGHKTKCALAGHVEMT